ncbi:hypothetical protein ALP06_200121 [Pseudomonas coronafaciens pv. atropurpurea]|nr:hypothetical protein ALP06_200121 [Pseudomonas coronafaciens pv. atropurpurea]
MLELGDHGRNIHFLNSLNLQMDSSYLTQKTRRPECQNQRQHSIIGDFSSCRRDISTSIMRGFWHLSSS